MSLLKWREDKYISGRGKTTYECLEGEKSAYFEGTAGASRARERVKRYGCKMAVVRWCSTFKF